MLGVVHQTNADDIIPMAQAGAIGYKIFFGETIGNLPFPDDGMCIEVFSNITKSRRAAVRACREPSDPALLDQQAEGGRQERSDLLGAAHDPISAKPSRWRI